MLVKELPITERPREKALKFGIHSLSNRELLAILIRNGYQGKSSLGIADDILFSCNGIGNLSSVDLNDLLKIKGIKKVKALEILTCIEIARRIAFEEALTVDVIDEPKAIINWLNKEIGFNKQENFMVIYLDIKNRIITYKILFKGTIDHSLVHPREIIKEALLVSSSKIMLIHNHPSGDPTPSQADIKMTKQVIEATSLVGINVLDHIIVSSNRYFSLAQSKLM
ncbi:MAG: DNA repair protein RadC [Erysipelotrichaceae bacterium]|nr:DNA repair protein RadC [Erysipelotrichaceae bacterium]